MPKVNCPKIDCYYNVNEACESDEIDLMEATELEDNPATCISYEPD